MPRSAGLHAVTSGAFGTMTLAVMTRAALGHTGRALTADGWTVAVYVLVNLGALARVAAAFALGGHLAVLDAAGLAWGGGSRSTRSATRRSSSARAPRPARTRPRSDRPEARLLVRR